MRHLPRRLVRRFGLRAKMTTIFALGALLVSAVLAIVTYEAARTFLVSERTSTVLHQSYLNAWSTKGALLARPSHVTTVLDFLEGQSGSESLLYYQGQWFSPSAAMVPGSLPSGFRSQVLAGHPSHQTFLLSGQPELAVGIPLPAVKAAYVSVFPLADLASTLSLLRDLLLPAAAATTVAGALVGRWVSGRLLRPIARTARAASQVAGGDLDVRLDSGPDPDLAALAQAFNQMTAALQSRIERDARFASTVSHELRSPLTTLRASLAVLLSRRRELSEPAARALDLLDAEVGRFNGLVQDLLEISRIDAGSADVTVEPVRIGELVRHAVATRGPGIPVEVAEPAAETVVMADKRRLERVLANLLDNAEVHGGGARRVAVERGNGKVRIAVEDAGPGVPAGERARIFERFARGTSARGRRATEGSGLGLALVEEHLQLVGGRVWVEDRPGGGARFVAELPADDA
jgi:two-component system, OmpR family, sensor histidine kinase MtrB